MGKYTNDGRPVERGKLATSLRDFKGHIDGSGWRQDATTVDMAPPLSGFSAKTVQTTLEQLKSAILTDGTGFISIGTTDGYDGYALGDYNVGSLDTPTFADAFNAAIANSRLANGGLIFVLPGFYHTSNTIMVPAGISIMGEPSASIIIAEADFPIFKVLAGTEIYGIGANSGMGQLSVQEGSPTNENKFFNLVLSDNLRGLITSGGNVVATLQTSPMILCETGSKLTCEDVKFIGKVNDGSITGRGKTFRAIDYTAGNSNATSLTLKRCFFDGLMSGVHFNPANGLIDNLTVDFCRARTFGTESGDLDVTKNCFISMTVCNAQLTNNYHIGVDNGTLNTVFNCFNVTTTSGSYDSKIIVANNSGGPATSTTTAKLFQQPSGLTLKTIQTNNNWGSSTQNPWYVTVGYNLDDSSSAGDFAGPGAIDLLLDANFKYSTTVVVNPGTYTITGQNAANYNFIGNSLQNSYPIFDLQITSSSPDPVGNRHFKVGTKLKGIKFKSTGHYTSVKLAAIVNRNVEINDCIFENTALTFAATGVSSSIDLFKIQISNCQFTQTGAFSDNISLFLPMASSIILENCSFLGNGPVGGIGDNSTLSYSNTAPKLPHYIIKNCLFDLDSSTITSLLTGFTNYFYVNDTNAKLTIDNCSIICSDTFGKVTPISVGLNTTFTEFVKVTVRDLIVNGCTINGPTQTFVDGSVNTRPLPALWVNSSQSCKITNSRFLEGGLPLQLADVIWDSNLRDALIVSNNEFTCTGTIALCVIDFDGSLTDVDDTVSQILIEGNNIRVLNTSAPYVPLHQFITGSSYSILAPIQIYGHFYDVNVINNHIFVNELVMPSTQLGISHLSGLVVNNTDSGSNNAKGFFTCNVEGNTIKVKNNFASTTATESASAAYLKSSHLKMHNNILNMNNAATVSTSDILCAYINNRPNTGSISEGMVNNNLFSRLNYSTNTLTNLNTGYVYIKNGAGRITNNTFDSDKNNGSSFVCINDSTGNWIAERNKNHTQSIGLTAQNGRFTAGSSSVYAFGDSSVNIESIDGIAVQFGDATNETGLFVYSGGAVTNIRYAGWYLNLNEVLPQNVFISSITANLKASLNVTGGEFCDWTARLQCTGQTDLTTGPTSVDTSGEFLTTSTSSNHGFIVSPATNLVYSLRGKLKHSAGFSVSLLSVAIVYTWL